MIIPAKKPSRWPVWVSAYGVLVAIVLFLSIGIYRITRNAARPPTSRRVLTPMEQALQAVLPKALVPVPPTPTPRTPQKTSEYLRGGYLKLEKDTLELQGTAGLVEKIKIGDQTEFTCAPRYLRDAQGTPVDTATMYLVVKPGSTYIVRSSASPFLGRLMFEGMVTSGDSVLVALSPATDDAIRVTLLTDPCDPGKWKL